jgi:hypothetical protein
MKEVKKRGTYKPRGNCKYKSGQKHTSDRYNVCVRGKVRKLTNREVDCKYKSGQKQHTARRIGFAPFAIFSIILTLNLSINMGKKYLSILASF